MPRYGYCGNVQYNDFILINCLQKTDALKVDCVETVFIAFSIHMLVSHLCIVLSGSSL